MRLFRKFISGRGPHKRVGFARPAVTVMCVSQECLFPTLAISIRMRVSSTHITDTTTYLATTSHSDMCFPGKYVSPEILLIFIHYWYVLLTAV